MTDLHTHILPCMDDGARDERISIAMLRAEWQQGVDTVVLTPHCYCKKEPIQRFLRRRETAKQRLDRAMVGLQEQLPRLLLGAEVAWAPHMAEWPELEQLCIQGTKRLLLELPLSPWTDQMIRDICDMMGQRGVTPILAHLERYQKHQDACMFRKVLSLGVPVQLSSTPLQGGWRERRTLVKMLKKEQAHLLASDCHNLTSRVPDLRKGLDAAAGLLGAERARQLMDTADRLVQPEMVLAVHSERQFAGGSEKCAL